MRMPVVGLFDPQNGIRPNSAALHRARDWELLALDGAACSVQDAVAVVVAVDDQRGAGVRFLRAMKKRNSPAGRVLVCDADAAVRAVARGEPAHQTVTGRSPQKVAAAVRRALGVSALLSDPVVTAAVADLGDVPTIPQTWRKLSAVLESDTASMREAAAVIESDVGLAVRVLQLVNSGMYGLSRPVSSLGHAVNLLGLQMIRDLVLAIDVLDDLSSVDLPPELAPIPLPRLSQLVALTARKVAPRAATDAAFTAGLLANLGRLMLVARARERYAQVIASSRSFSDLSVQERAVFGSDGRTIGAWLIARWGLPHEVVDAVRYSDHPERATGRAAPLALSVYLASVLVQEAAHERRSHQPLALVSRADLAPWGMGDALESWRGHVRGLLAS